MKKNGTVSKTLLNFTKKIHKNIFFNLPEFQKPQNFFTKSLHTWTKFQR